MQPLDLVAAARRLMREADLAPDFPPSVEEEARQAALPGDEVRDLRSLPWSSIDNATSRDLDQLEWAERQGGGRTRLLVAIADADALVPAGGAVDAHAAQNTTSVYTGVATFPMLPLPLSEGLTSLLPGADRRAMVVEMIVAADGTVERADAYRALVRNAARLVYEDVGRWLEEGGPPPVPASSPLAAQLRLHDELGRALATRRLARGALSLETVEARPVVEGGRVVDLAVTARSPARALVEDFMLAANAATAGLLEARDRAWIRRTVGAPKRWDRAVAVARALGEALRDAPSAPALSAFVARRRAADPEGFAELSLTIVKLLGPGSYALERRGEDLEGHFGLAVADYTHSTAPNRRYADLVTQRLLKAALAGRPAPYDEAALQAIAERCTRKEDDARKVERRVRKMAAAQLLSARVGETFDAIVTGKKGDGTYARLLAPPAEGRVVAGEAGLDVGDRVRLRLVATDVERGFVDFAPA